MYTAEINESQYMESAFMAYVMPLWEFIGCDQSNEMVSVGISGALIEKQILTQRSNYYKQDTRKFAKSVFAK